MTDLSFVFPTDTLQNIELFKSGQSPEGLNFINIQKASRSYRTTIEATSKGELLDGDYGTSLLCKMINAEDFEKLEDEAMKQLPEGIEFKHFVHDEMFFLKLGVNGKNFKADITPSTRPGDTKSPFYSGCALKINCTPTLWINFDMSKAGIFLKISKIVIDNGKRKK